MPNKAKRDDSYTASAEGRSLEGARPTQEQRLGGENARCTDHAISPARRAIPKTPSTKNSHFEITYNEKGEKGWIEKAKVGVHVKKRSPCGGKHHAVDVELDPVLHESVKKLCNEAISRGLVTKSPKLTQAVRLPKIAHLWSTAYNIKKYLTGFTPPEDGKDTKVRVGNKNPTNAILLWNNLCDLEGGLDLDGWRWCRDKGGRFWSLAEILKNANAILDNDGITNIAAEGYAKGCPWRLPNIDDRVGVSLHVTGNAIDVSIKWKDGWGGFGHKPTENLIADCGLYRPIKPKGKSKGEPWHYQRGFDFEALDVNYEFDLTQNEFVEK